MASPSLIVFLSAVLALKISGMLALSLKCKSDRASDLLGILQTLFKASKLFLLSSCLSCQLQCLLFPSFVGQLLTTGEVSSSNFEMFSLALQIGWLSWAPVPFSASLDQSTNDSGWKLFTHLSLCLVTQMLPKCIGNGLCSQETWRTKTFRNV